MPGRRPISKMPGIVTLKERIMALPPEHKQLLVEYAEGRDEFNAEQRAILAPFTVFPTVDSRSTAITSNSASWSVAVPAHNNGDMLLMIIGMDGAPTVNSVGSVNGVSWTLNLINTPNGTANKLYACWLRATSNQATDINVTVALSATEQGIARVWAISGAHASTAPAVGTAATGSSTTPNPPNLDPAGWATEDTLWFAAVSTDAAVTATAYPSNMNTATGFTDVSGGGNGAGLHTCRYMATALASLDPNTFTLSATETWVAQTVAIRPAPNPVTLEQAQFRFRNDDGSESAATWKAAVNTAGGTIDADTRFRLRMTVDETGAGTDPAAATYKLQSRVGAGSWQDVTSSATIARPSASPNVTDGAATTQQLSSGLGTFVAGSFDEVDGAVASVDLGIGGVTELEWSLALYGAGEQIAPGNTVEFRVVTTAGGLLNAYPQSPTLTVGAVVRKARVTWISMEVPAAAGTNISGSDASGAGSDAGARSAAIPGADASGAGSDASARNAAIPATDANTGEVESATYLTFKAGADTNGALAELAAFFFLLAGADASGAASDAASPTVSPAGADASGAASDAGVRQAFYIVTDANGAIADAAIRQAFYAVTDVNGAVTEATGVTQRNDILGSDAGASSDASALAAAEAGADTGSGADTGAPGATPSASDAATVSDAATPAAAEAGTDSGSASEAGTTAAPKAGADASGAGSDTGAYAGAYAVSDASGAGSDSGAPSAASAGSDSGSGGGETGAAGQTQSVSGSDSRGVVTEAFTLAAAATGTETPSIVDVAAMVAALVGADTGGATGELSSNGNFVFGADSIVFSLTEQAIRNAVIAGADVATAAEQATQLVALAASDLMGTPVDQATLVTFIVTADVRGAVTEQAVFTVALAATDVNGAIGESVVVGVSLNPVDVPTVGENAELTGVQINKSGADSVTAADLATFLRFVSALDTLPTVAAEAATYLAAKQADDVNGSVAENAILPVATFFVGENVDAQEFVLLAVAVSDQDARGAVDEIAAIGFGAMMEAILTGHVIRQHRGGSLAHSAPGRVIRGLQVEVDD